MDKIKRIQRHWRAFMKVDEERQKELQQLWNSKVQDLIKRNTAKGKRMQNLVRKLQVISADIRDKVLKDYYMNLKMKHLRNLKKLLRTQQSRPISPVSQLFL